MKQGLRELRKNQAIIWVAGDQELPGRYLGTTVNLLPSVGEYYDFAFKHPFVPGTLSRIEVVSASEGALFIQDNKTNSKDNLPDAPIVRTFYYGDHAGRDGTEFSKLSMMLSTDGGTS